VTKQVIIDVEVADHGRLAAFAEHMAKCARCCRYKTLSTRTPVCVAGIMLAGQAAQILREHGLGAVPPGLIGTQGKR
jgi:cation transporter-like permease